MSREKGCFLRKLSWRSEFIGIESIDTAKFDLISTNKLVSKFESQLKTFLDNRTNSSKEATVIFLGNKILFLFEKNKKDLSELEARYEGMYLSDRTYYAEKITKIKFKILQILEAMDRLAGGDDSQAIKIFLECD